MWRWLLVAAALLAAVTALAVFLPTAFDFHHVFRPAVWDWLRGDPVYVVGVQERALLNPPWMLLLLLPFALPPEALGRALLVAFTAVVFILVLRSTRRRRPALALALASFPFLVIAWNGQLEAIPLLGIWLGGCGLRWGSPWALSAGLFLMSAKPQGTLLAALWMIWHARHWSWSRLLRVAALPAIAVSYALLAFGSDWLTVMVDAGTGYAGRWVNVSWAWRFLAPSSPLLAVAWSAGISVAALFLAASVPAGPYPLALVVTANVLASPYVATHHLAVPLVLAWPWLFDRQPKLALLVYATLLTPLARLSGAQSLSWLDFLFPLALMAALLAFRRQGGDEELLCD